jgi:hypothetical protein
MSKIKGRRKATDPSSDDNNVLFGTASHAHRHDNKPLGISYNHASKEEGQIVLHFDGVDERSRQTAFGLPYQSNNDFDFYENLNLITFF